MATVTHQLRMPDGSVPPSASISIRLIATTDPGLTAEGHAAGYSIAGESRPVIDGTGTWTAALVPNNVITPANTVYEIVEALPRVPAAKFYISVPTLGGAAETMLTPLPGSLPPGPTTFGSAQVTIGDQGAGYIGPNGSWEVPGVTKCDGVLVLEAGVQIHNAADIFATAAAGAGAAPPATVEGYFLMYDPAGNVRKVAFYR